MGSGGWRRSRGRSVLSFVAVVGATALIGACWPPVSYTAEVELRWTRPDTLLSGGLCPRGYIQGYLLERASDGDTARFYVPVADDPDTVRTSLTVDAGALVAARVAAVDTTDRSGPWSEWSEQYRVDLGPVGPPLIIFIGRGE